MPLPLLSVKLRRLHSRPMSASRGPFNIGCDSLQAMAPMLSLSRAQLIELLEDRRAEKGFTVHLGSGHPDAVLRKEDGGWVLRKLEVDHEAANRAGEEALARGESWMPEHVDQFKSPGEAILEASTAAQMAGKVREMTWTYWDEGFDAKYFKKYKKQLLG